MQNQVPRSLNPIRTLLEKSVRLIDNGQVLYLDTDKCQDLVPFIQMCKMNDQKLTVNKKRIIQFLSQRQWIFSKSVSELDAPQDAHDPDINVLFDELLEFIATTRIT
jgi:hypothetical protein